MTEPNGLIMNDTVERSGEGSDFDWFQSDMDPYCYQPGLSIIEDVQTAPFDGVPTQDEYERLESGVTSQLPLWTMAEMQWPFPEQQQQQEQQQSLYLQVEDSRLQLLHVPAFPAVPSSGLEGLCVDGNNIPNHDIFSHGNLNGAVIPEGGLGPMLPLGLLVDSSQQTVPPGPPFEDLDFSNAIPQGDFRLAKAEPIPLQGVYLAQVEPLPPPRTEPFSATQAPVLNPGISIEIAPATRIPRLSIPTTAALNIKATNFRCTQHLPSGEACGREFKRTSELDRHTHSVHERACVEVCTECPTPQMFARRDILNRHIRRYHPGKPLLLMGTSGGKKALAA